MTLKDRVVEFVRKIPQDERVTHRDMHAALGAPMPSIRRAAVRAMREGLIHDAGSASYNPNIVTYTAVEP